MKKTSAFWIAALIVCLFAGKYASIALFGPSDERQIQAALREALAATREGRPGGVMDFLAKQFKINDEEPQSREIFNFIKNSHPDITVDNPTPVISGDKARITSPVDIKGDLLGHSFERRIDPVSMVFEREPAREWLILPTTRWRLAQVFVPDDVTLESFEQ